MLVHLNLSLSLDGGHLQVGVGILGLKLLDGLTDELEKVRVRSSVLNHLKLGLLGRVVLLVGVEVGGDVFRKMHHFGVGNLTGNAHGIREQRVVSLGGSLCVLVRPRLDEIIHSLGGGGIGEKVRDRSVEVQRSVSAQGNLKESVLGSSLTHQWRRGQIKVLP
jgi:hypothetical protein